MARIYADEMRGFLICEHRRHLRLGFFALICAIARWAIDRGRADGVRTEAVWRQGVVGSQFSVAMSGNAFLLDAGFDLAEHGDAGADLDASLAQLGNSLADG